MATGKQNCRMGQKGLPPGPGEVNLVSGTRGFTSEGQRWPTTLPAPTALTMSAEDTLPGKCCFSGELEEEHGALGEVVSRGRGASASWEQAYV